MVKYHSFLHTMKLFFYILNLFNLPFRESNTRSSYYKEKQQPLHCRPMPTMKLFSLLSARLYSLHCIRTFPRFIMAYSKVNSDVVKSSIYIFIQSCDISTKMLITARQNVSKALHKPNGKIEHAKVPHGHVNIVFSLSL